MSQDWVKDNLEFRQGCGLLVNYTPKLLPKEHVELHFKLLREELDELATAIEKEDVAGVADAYADLIYYAIGGALAHGIDLRPVWDEVQRANMRKLGGPKREDGKQLKPVGWVGPDIYEALHKGELCEWGTCLDCDSPIDFRGYCISKDCDYHTHFQHEEVA